MLSYKAENAGMRLVRVDPKYTTQECSNCHNIKKGKERLTLKDRIYICNMCGLQIDRDINASINTLNRALQSSTAKLDSFAVKGRAGLARTYAQGDICLYPSTGRASSVEELRTYSANAGEAPTFR
ncbi:protein containing Transposase, IS605 OrfB [mine drainage metagenome]|uniref:Protein containing Transposase, IS605 OrfB n=1 Tax=mine drainage metagenome TaxID=410659 RepID=T1C5K2_9ZZZZ